MPEITSTDRAKIVLDEAIKRSATPEYQTHRLLEAIALALISNAEESKKIADQLGHLLRQAEEIQRLLRNNMKSF